MKFVIGITVAIVVMNIALWASGYGVLVKEYDKVEDVLLQDGSKVAGIRVSCTYWLGTESVEFTIDPGTFCNRWYKVR